MPDAGEARDIHVRAVVWAAAAIAAGILLAALAAYLLWQRWGAPSTAAAPPALESEPAVLESAPQREGDRYFSEQQKHLESWGWVDRDAGIARIPLEEAMRIMAAGGGARKAAPSKEQR